MSRSGEEGTPQKTGKEGWIPHPVVLQKAAKHSALVLCCRYVSAGQNMDMAEEMVDMMEESLLKAQEQLWTPSLNAVCTSESTHMVQTGFTGL